MAGSRKSVNLLVDGPAWIDAEIAEAFSCRTTTVENIRQRLVERRFTETINGASRLMPPVAKLLDGEQEVKIMALRLGSPSKGYNNWTLRLLARKVVEPEIVDFAIIGERRMVTWTP